MASTSYAIALGSNRRHGRHGSPAATVRAAIEALAERQLEVEAVSQVRLTPAMGPAGRSFANAAILVATDLDPPELLAELKQLERSFGRRAGRRWGQRVIDLDILLWSEGPFEGPGLVIPHPAMRERAFVLEPLVEIAPTWRDPITGLTVRQLRSRLAARTPVDRTAARS
ncbi:MAG TPA: 2-amino-4-hydroxy-6-hydroxymethyldihydropteridine diphosphokinase [Allosphingosinicella sp.]|nr:2-amino-4-hydroxy-6-hydroxymethyldihydropteridine diphosphokinase [Allosphingosinicella sp.]